MLIEGVVWTFSKSDVKRWDYNIKDEMDSSIHDYKTTKKIDLKHMRQSNNYFTIVKHNNWSKLNEVTQFKN